MYTGVGNDFLARTQFVLQLTKTIDKWDLKTKKDKKIINPLKSKPMKWDRIFANYTFIEVSYIKYKKKSKYKDSRKQIGYGSEQVVLRRRNKIGKEISLVVLVIPNN